ncbi:hypothetical protein [Leptolyngbya sp. FACHB-8]|nr:hypothetical protein [Leptolyngbya sp. FACHB-8]MBD1911328.1 hypothetical protein [Leptolyngbya sp. FACHB-8]
MTAFTPVKAETKLSSFNVATLAYQGQLTEQGIPGYASLEAGVNSGRITAEDVVQAAIDADRLSENTLKDQAFVTAVERHLQNLVDTQ